MCFRQTGLIFTIIIICSVVSSWANGKIETRIGPFNLSSSPVTESKFISQFGEGYVQIDKVGDKLLGKKHIYYSRDEKVWVEIFFSHVRDEKLERIFEAVLITKKRLCDERFEPKNTFGSLATSKGIRIGDSLTKVLRLYGKPTIDIELGKDKIFSALVKSPTSVGLLEL